MVGRAFGIVSSALVLEIVEGADAGRQVSLGGSIDIGREPGLALTLADDQASRHHARLTAEGGGAVVEDLGSTNGTYVNDQPLFTRRLLVPGDRIRIGTTVFELRTPEDVKHRPTAMRPIPQLTAIGREVLAPVHEEQLPASRPVAAGVPLFLAEESEPAYVPAAVAEDEQARTDYEAVAALADSRVKRQTGIAAFALLSAAGLALLIFFGLR